MKREVNNFSKSFYKEIKLLFSHSQKPVSLVTPGAFVVILSKQQEKITKVNDPCLFNYPQKRDNYIPKNLRTWETVS